MSSGNHWIKVTKMLLDSPKMMAIAVICGCSVEVAFACWFRLYCYFDSHTDDGLIQYLLPAAIDRISGLPRMAEALEDIGWIRFKDGICIIEEWDKHNGKSAKKRLLHSQSQNKYKTAKSK